MSQSARTLLTLALLLAVGAGIGLYAWKGVYEHDEKESKQKDVEERLFSPLKADEKGADGAVATFEFVKLKLTSGGQTTVLERASGSEPWKMVEPVAGAPVDRVAVDGVTTQLQTSKFKYVADENPDEAALKKYGLETPAFVVEAEALVGDAKERRSVKLVGGAENTFNGSIFMRRNDDKKVWGAEGGVKWAFQKTPFELRAKEVVDFDEQKVTRVEVKTKNNEFTLERDAERNWVVKTPKPGKGEEPEFLADQGAISGALGGLKGERATAFPTEAVSFDAPFEDVLLTLEGGDKIHVKLAKIGGADAGPSHVYLSREDKNGTTVAEVTENVLALFDRHPWDIRDRSVMQIKKDAVAKVLFHLADGTELTVQKETADAGTAETWRVTAPQQGPAKQFKMAALLWSFGSVKAVEVIEEKPKDLKKYGFDRWVVLSDSAGKELGRLMVGGDVKGKEGMKYLRGSRDQVVTGDGSRLADLPTRLDDLLEAPPPPAPPPAPPTLKAFDAGVQ